MKSSTKLSHDWDPSPAQAARLQESLSPQVIRDDLLGSVRHVAGVDVAYAEEGDGVAAAVVVLSAEDLSIVESRTACVTTVFPYVPGLFSFRELPPILRAMEEVQCEPDLIVCDGQGVAHPRRFGLACHLGVLFDVPTIGCGKTPLCGNFESPGPARGASSPLVDGDEVIGSVLRTQQDVNPVFVSIGHRVSLATAVRWVLRLAPRYRLPETTRQADQAVRRALNRS